MKIEDEFEWNGYKRRNRARTVTSSTVQLAIGTIYGIIFLFLCSPLFACSVDGIKTALFVFVFGMAILGKGLR